MRDKATPLASRMRPRKMSEFVGQHHLLAPNKSLYQLITAGHLHSMILWGPPGTGKTTLAEIIANSADAAIERISAVLAGVKDIRTVIARSQERWGQKVPTVLFVDEVHHFSKSQQDVFLPHVEQGIITLIGATTENPSFQLNNALLSRARVYVLKTLNQSDCLKILQRALSDDKNGLGTLNLSIPKTLLQRIAIAADGDARQALNLLEIVADFATVDKGCCRIDEAAVEQVLHQTFRRFDNRGEAFYDLISALHKSIRGSDADAGIYWFSRLVDGGCSPEYIARRLLRVASEDIGNADPRALRLALDAWETYQRLGSPEGELALAQAVIYCAIAPKSNAVYKAYNAAIQEVNNTGSLEVPLYLRNAPTKFMQSLDYGKGYRYAHDEPDGFAAGVDYLPDDLQHKQYYYPENRGLEIKIKKKLDHLKALNQQHKYKNRG